MTTFKQYEKKNGTRAWIFKGYLGTKPEYKKLSQTKHSCKLSDPKTDKSAAKILLDTETIAQMANKSAQV